VARPERWIQIALGRSSPLRGALRASKTLVRFFEQEFSSSSRHPKNKKAPEGTFWFLARPERWALGLSSLRSSVRTPDRSVRSWVTEL